MAHSFLAPCDLLERFRPICIEGASGFKLPPFGRWKTTTCVAGLRRTGTVAPWELDGPMNADAFLTYVNPVLLPDSSRGDVVVMDNLSSHKAPTVCTAIESPGATLLFFPGIFKGIGRMLPSIETGLRNCIDNLGAQILCRLCWNRAFQCARPQLKDRQS